MNVAAWLNGLTCVAPFTLDDVRELYNTLKTWDPRSIVDVHMIRDTVYVEVNGKRWTYVVA